VDDVCELVLIDIAVLIRNALITVLKREGFGRKLSQRNYTNFPDTSQVSLHENNKISTPVV
jgi:hypothetical protein